MPQNTCISERSNPLPFVALSIRPRWQSETEVSQSIHCCTLSNTRLPTHRVHAASSAPAVEEPSKSHAVLGETLPTSSTPRVQP